MKILSLYEHFFNLYKNQKYLASEELSSLSKVFWGYSREEIEDLLVPIGDKYELPIAITFDYQNSKRGSNRDYLKSTSIEHMLTNLKNLISLYENGSVIPVINISIHTNPELSNKFCGMQVDFPVYFKNGEYNEDLGEKMHNGYNSICDDIIKMIPQISKRIDDYKLEYFKSLDIDNTYWVDSKGIESGRSFFTIVCEKIKPVKGT